MTRERQLIDFYYKLLEIFGDREFTLEELRKSGIFKYSEKSLNTLLSRLRKRGLLIVKKNEIDMRKSVYKLVKHIPLSVSGKDTRKEIIDLMKAIADLVRGKVDYEILLILLFYKAACDNWEYEYKKTVGMLIEEGIPEEEAKEEAKDKSYHVIDIPEDCLWSNVITTTDKLTIRIRDAIKEIADRNPKIKSALEKFLRYFDDLIGKKDSDTIMRQIVEQLNRVNFSNVQTDILGEAYEWIINYFAPLKAKAGELFTPREVVKLLIELLEPDEIRRKILDPAAGSGGMLIYSYKHVKEKKGEDVAKKLILVGQEAKDINYAIMLLNFYLHGIPIGQNVKLYLEDSLLRPQFKNDGKFDIVVFNPPWNQDGYGEESLKKSNIREAYVFGYPPNNTADWAWIQLALHFTKDDGKVGIIIDNGALFRGGREAEIRKKIVEKDWVEAIILLPEKLFYNTGAPGVIIIFNKKKFHERIGKILFINASEYFEKHPEVRKMNKLKEEGIKRIVEVYKEWKEVSGFSRVVSLEDIRRNDYNLNVTLYVTPKIDEERIDIKQIWNELHDIDKELNEIDGKIKGWIEEVMKL